MCFRDISLIVFLALKWFDAEGKAEPYEGGRDLDALAALYVLVNPRLFLAFCSNGQSSA